MRLRPMSLYVSEIDQNWVPSMSSTYYAKIVSYCSSGSLGETYFLLLGLPPTSSAELSDTNQELTTGHNSK
jgi:hypothetical protein